MLGSFLQTDDNKILQKLRSHLSRSKCTAILQAMTAAEEYVTTLENVEKAKGKVAEAIKQSATVSNSTSCGPSKALEQAVGRRNDAWKAHLQAAEALKAARQNIGILEVNLWEESLWLEEKAYCSFGMSVSSYSQGSAIPKIL